MAVFLDGDVCKIRGLLAGAVGDYAIEDPESPSRTLKSPREGREDWTFVGSRSHGLALENSVVLYNSKTHEFREWIVGTGGEFLRQHPLDPALGRPLLETAKERA